MYDVCKLVGIYLCCALIFLMETTFYFIFQVICSVCNQVSVTFEPFMYLSVPIPHAMERQICK